MKRIILTTVALLALSTQCFAGISTSTTSTKCLRVAGGGMSCTTVRNEAEPEGERPLTAADRAEIARANADKQIRINKWESFCKPIPGVDDMGVTRLVYAHTNCDLGRDH